MALNILLLCLVQLKETPLGPGYPLAGENYTIASSFDVPWLIALLPGLATDILAGSYQLEFR